MTKKDFKKMTSNNKKNKNERRKNKTKNDKIC